VLHRGTISGSVLQARKLIVLVVVKDNVKGALFFPVVGKDVAADVAAKREKYRVAEDTGPSPAIRSNLAAMDDSSSPRASIFGRLAFRSLPYSHSVRLYRTKVRDKNKK
jgi:hypothetical protein